MIADQHIKMCVERFTNDHIFQIVRHYSSVIYALFYIILFKNVFLFYFQMENKIGNTFLYIHFGAQPSFRFYKLDIYVKNDKSCLSFQLYLYVSPTKFQR